MELFYPTSPNFTSCVLEPRNLPNKQTDACFKKLKDLSHVTNVKILIHGFLKSAATEWLHEEGASERA